MVIRNVELETVCGVTSTLPENTLPEFAFSGKIKRGKIFPDQRAHEPESVGENVLPAGKDPDDQLL